MVQHLCHRALTLFTCLLFLAAPAFAQGSAGKKPLPAPASAGAPVDLNSASEKDLEALPGVGASTARKIIAGRPYTSTADLSKAGVSKATIDKINGLVTVGATSAPATRPQSESRRPSSSPAPSGPVDLNTASEKDLEALPGVGPATAKKIIAARPYTSAADLSKAGVPNATIQKVTPLVTASAAPAPPAAPRAPRAPVPPAPTSSNDRPTTAPSGGTSTPAYPSSRPDAPAQQPPSAGMVWVNLDTKVFHHAGDRYYGKTKHGKWMTEADALAAGYRASKSGPK